MINPAKISAVCVANVDATLIEKHWDALVHLSAAVMSGTASAVAALTHFGSAAEGDPIYEAGYIWAGCCAPPFFTDRFVITRFRNEL